MYTVGKDKGAKGSLGMLRKFGKSIIDFQITLVLARHFATQI